MSDQRITTLARKCKTDPDDQAPWMAFLAECERMAVVGCAVLGYHSIVKSEILRATGPKMFCRCCGRAEKRCCSECSAQAKYSYPSFLYPGPGGESLREMVWIRACQKHLLKVGAECSHCKRRPAVWGGKLREFYGDPHDEGTRADWASWQEVAPSEALCQRCVDIYHEGPCMSCGDLSQVASSHMRPELGPLCPACVDEINDETTLSLVDHDPDPGWDETEEPFGWSGTDGQAI